MARVTRIPVAVQTLAEAGTTNAYLVGSDPAILVDPAGRSPALDAAVARTDVADVLVTHAHPDHVDGVAYYADRTGATVWARDGRTGRFERATGASPDRSFETGTTMTAGDGTTVTVVDTPGHAADHVALVVGGTAAEEAILTGDLVVAEGSVVGGADHGDMRAYLTSLRRLHARNPTALYPGHGPVIEAPREELARLVRHRLERERRVLDAVRAGARTPDDVLDRAYDKDLTGVRPYARSTVVAHLRKLDTESTVDWDGTRATPR